MAYRLFILNDAVPHPALSGLERRCFNFAFLSLLYSLTLIRITYISFILYTYLLRIASTQINQASSAA